MMKKKIIEFLLQKNVADTLRKVIIINMRSIDEYFEKLAFGTCLFS